MLIPIHPFIHPFIHSFSVFSVPNLFLFLLASSAAHSRFSRGECCQSMPVPTKSKGPMNRPTKSAIQLALRTPSGWPAQKCLPHRFWFPQNWSQKGRPFVGPGRKCPAPGCSSVQWALNAGQNHFRKTDRLAQCVNVAHQGMDPINEGINGGRRLGRI